MGGQIGNAILFILYLQPKKSNAVFGGRQQYIRTTHLLE